MAQQLQQQSIQLRMFWEQQHLEIQQVGTDPAEFKNHQLPLARIKKVAWSIVPHTQRIGIQLNTLHSFLLKECHVQIMKSDEDVRMISAEAPVLFAKVLSIACMSFAWHEDLDWLFYSLLCGTCYNPKLLSGK
jgi:hypothetical protein